MMFKLKDNPNYCATIVKIKSIVDLDNCDNLCATKIFGNNVLINTDTTVGTLGVYFPVESALSKEFLSNNNLYRCKEENIDKTKTGFFEPSGRVKCLKMRGHRSEGIFLPITCLNYLNSPLDNLKIGLEFDHYKDQVVCRKYKIEKQITHLIKKERINNKISRFDKLINNQFRFHVDTAQLGKNIHKFRLTDTITISEKLHGTSHVSSYILCNRKLTWKDRVAKMFGVSVEEKEYSNIYSSRKMIKNQYLYKKPCASYYQEDIWKYTNGELKPYLMKGMTIYCEVVGYTPTGGCIQGKYDYGCKQGEHKNYIYRVTMTTPDGDVIEWPMMQVKDWCDYNNLLCVPIHFHGDINEYFSKYYDSSIDISGERWRDNFIENLKKKFLEKKCYLCSNAVPNEGIVVRKDVLDIEAYKLKSFKFLQGETKDLDKGIITIEDKEG